MVQSDLFLEKYQIHSSRLPDWDYATPGWYFVTICTKDRKIYFGEIVDDKMIRSTIGEVAHKIWIEIPSHHNNVLLDEFIIMPDHLHGLLMLNNSESVETLHATSLRSDIKSTSKFHSQISPKKDSLSTIIRSYKSAVTREIRKTITPTFAWQSRFYDHVIRNEWDLDDLRQYINLNPEKNLTYA